MGKIFNFTIGIIMKFFKTFIFGLMLLYVYIPVSFGQTIGEQLKTAQSLYKEKKYDQAIPHYEKIVEILKKNNQLLVAQKVQINLANIYLIQGKYDLALKELETAEGLYDKPEEKTKINLYSKQATANHELKHYAVASQILEQLFASGVTLVPAQKANLQAKLADAYRRNEIYSKALQAYSDTLKFYELEKNAQKEVLILNAMGLSYNKLGDFPNAIKCLEESLSLALKIQNPQSIAEANSNLGIVYWDTGEYPKALKYIAKAKEVEHKSQLNRNLGVDLNNEGLVLKSVGKYNKGLASIEQAIQIAKEVKNIKDEAIAWSNYALIKRIQGTNNDAFQGYQNALKLYEQDKFQEGMASCYLGLGKLYEIRDQNYQFAYDNYQRAYKIYEELGNLGYQAEALNQIGRVLKKNINRQRTTRDLIFEDEAPTFIDILPSMAVTESIAAYEKALDLGRVTMRNEVIWSALQGLGFALKEQGNLEDSFSMYTIAVDTVINIKGGSSDSELMADYLKDKEDLFTEAMEVCAALYSKTKDKKYLCLQMEYQEIYKNEIMKNAMNVANLKFEDPTKAKLADQMNALLAKKKKVTQLQSQYQSSLSQKTEAKDKAGQADQEQKKTQIKKEVKKVQAEAAKLEGTFKELLAKWRKQYPSDANLFDSAAKVDLNVIQSRLNENEAIIQYMPLSDLLSIICITKEDIYFANVKVPYVELASLIRDKFMFDNIEEYGHSKTDLSEEQSYSNCVNVLNQLYNILIAPVTEHLKNKSKLIIVTSKYLSYIPFSALTRSTDPANPQFLIHDYTISYTRLAFFKTEGKDSDIKAFAGGDTVIGVGNPVHKFLKATLGDLPAAEEEVDKMAEAAKKNKMQAPKIMKREAATETAWKKEIKSKPYSIMYFATHGVPFAEIYFDTKKISKAVTKWKNNPEKYQKKINMYEPFIEFSEQTFISKSPLYGFLYMAYSGSEADDGVLTLKEILELPDACFKNARLAVLSACNTAVTYSPKITAKERQTLENAEVSKELVKAGFTPGVDQVSLTDSFMKRNFKSILGTLWFADDAATGFIISKFFDNLGAMKPSEALRQAQLTYLESPPMDTDYTKVPKHPYYWAVSSIFGE